MNSDFFSILNFVCNENWHDLYDFFADTGKEHLVRGHNLYLEATRYFMEDGKVQDYFDYIKMLEGKE